MYLIIIIVCVLVAALVLRGVRGEWKARRSWEHAMDARLMAHGRALTELGGAVGALRVESSGGSGRSRSKKGRGAAPKKACARRRGS